MSIIMAPFLNRKQPLGHLLVVSFQIHSLTSLIINTAPEDKLRVFDRYESDSRAASGLLKSAEHIHRKQQELVLYRGRSLHLNAI